ncbi:MAG: AAA family ATPase [Proteobacteria bacterium]|nr:AAA family ATPase [Pseudomonadota bacterium]
MTKQGDSLAAGLCAKGVLYRFLYCDGCRREWPAEHTSCPECLRWLGEKPQQRTEWQLVPCAHPDLPPAGFDLMGAVALSVRVVGFRPAEAALRAAASSLAQVLAGEPNAGVLPVAERGWMVWTRRGPRQAFRLGCALRDRLETATPGLEAAFGLGARLRWGLWVDEYVLPVGADGPPVVGAKAAGAIFWFEPDGLLLAAEGVFRANHSWEHFVCIPARRLDGSYGNGYRPLGRKRPSALDHLSALDHAEAARQTPFVGRARALARLEAAWRASRRATRSVTIVAPPGAGKTRLVGEWLRRHAEARAIRGNFSLFGGDVTSFAYQLAQLPADTLAPRALAARVLGRIDRERVDVLVLDDLHWAGAEAPGFLERLLSGIASRRMLVVLSTRPAGRRLARALSAGEEIRLRPLPPASVAELAGRLIGAPEVAARAARLAAGNPLFVEQFAAWAEESAYPGNGPCPRTLHQLIAARIRHLEEVRLGHLRPSLFPLGGWVRHEVEGELDEIESEIGRWLDRLETGDYADRTEVVQYLTRLERINFEIFMISMLAGRPRPRSSRLGEAIDRLMMGSADRILADMAARARRAGAAEDPNLWRDARRAGDCAFDDFRWRLADRFYRLALAAAPGWEEAEIEARRRACARRLGVKAARRALADGAGILDELDRDPAVDPLRLPEVWLRLGQRFRSRGYYRRAEKAAAAIGDRALARIAREAAEAARARPQEVSPAPDERGSGRRSGTARASTRSATRP